MAPKVAINETGTATPGMRVARALRKNTKTTAITSATASTSPRSTSRRDARIVVVRSDTTVMSIPRGIDSWSRGSKAFTRSTVSMMLAPGSRKRITSTEGRPLARPWLRRSSTESVTSATSASQTGDPFR